jgi:hypothetical protein
MELQIQPDFIEVKSPIDRFKEQWAQQPGAINILRQRNAILRNPELVQYADLAGIKGWTQPLFFALQGLVLTAFLISALSWWFSHDRGKQADEILAIQADLQSEAKTNQGVIDAAQFEIARIKTSRNAGGFTVASSRNLSKAEAIVQLNALMEETRKSQEAYQRKAEIKIQDLRATQDSLALAAAGTPLLLSLAILFAAQLFRKEMQKQQGRNPLTRRADSFYLYSVVSHGLLLNCILMLLLNLFLGRSAYGLGGIFESVGPVGQGVVWLALYALLLYLFLIVSKDLHKTMQIPRPLSWYGPENKVLLSMHNSFWLVFAPLEAALILLSWFVYLLERA